MSLDVDALLEQSLTNPPREGSRDRRKRSRSRDRGRRSRSRDRKRRSRSRDRSRRDRDRGDRDRRDRSDRGRDRRDRDRGDRDRDRGSKHRSRSRGRSRRSPTPEEEPVVDDDPFGDRDQRTIFIYNLSRACKENDIKEFFSTVGKVSSARLITDKNTGRSKGIGYVEFTNVETIPLAIGLSGQMLAQQPVMVQASQAEKNKQHTTTTSAPLNRNEPMRLQVSGLHPNITQDDVRELFAPFGQLGIVQLQTDGPGGKSRGIAIMEYKVADDAKKALNAMNGIEMAGSVLSVKLADPGQPAQRSLTDIMMGAGENLDSVDDNEGLIRGSQSRADLMSKLGGGVANSMAGPGGQLGAVPGMMPSRNDGPRDPSMSRCVQFIDMFDPAKEDDPDFHLDIKEDVEEECGKHGRVLYVYVDPQSQGHVWVKMTQPQEAAGARDAMNNRWFDGRMVKVHYIPEPDFNRKFPNAPS